jgi:hypothetical protein
MFWPIDPNNADSYRLSTIEPHFVNLPGLCARDNAPEGELRRRFSHSRSFSNKHLGSTYSILIEALSACLQRRIDDSLPGTRISDRLIAFSGRGRQD